MDIITLKLANAFAQKVAAGFSTVSVDGMTINFTLNDGTKTSLTVPKPQDGTDGVSVTGLEIDEDGSLLCHMSDGTTIDAGYVPSVKGDPGEPGYTPQKGIDYWTTEDKKEIEDYVDERTHLAISYTYDSKNNTLTFSQRI